MCIDILHDSAQEAVKTNTSLAKRFRTSAHLLTLFIIKAANVAIRPGRYCIQGTMQALMLVEKPLLITCDP